MDADKERKKVKRRMERDTENEIHTQRGRDREGER